MKQINRKKRGFTLVELVTVVAVTGVLAATVIPKVTTVNDDARRASLNGAAGALQGVGNSNFAEHGANNANGQRVRNCTHADTLLQGGVGSSFAITTQVIERDATFDCVLSTTSTPVLTTTFIGYGIGDEDPTP
jgi:prepilin-type N-terminal cleavage/methylation domain-containing protein